jgi:hypothetical protein
MRIGSLIRSRMQREFLAQDLSPRMRPIHQHPKRFCNDRRKHAKKEPTKEYRNDAAIASYGDIPGTPAKEPTNENCNADCGSYEKSELKTASMRAVEAPTAHLEDCPRPGNQVFNSDGPILLQ